MSSSTFNTPLLRTIDRLASNFCKAGFLIFISLHNTYISDLRGNDNIKLEKEVDFVVGKAVASMGPRQVLEAVPLNITGIKIRP